VRPCPLKYGLSLALAIGAILLDSGCEPDKSASEPLPTGETQADEPDPREPEDTTPSESERPAGAVYYEDLAPDMAIDFVHTDGSSGKYFIVETLASGAALFDYNSDGLLDLYFANGRMLPPGAEAAGTVIGATQSNVLFKQGAGGQFEDVTATANVPGTGFGIGAIVGDYDADGDLDLYVTQYGSNLLYQNQGNGTFKDVTEQAKVIGDGFSACASFFDYDADGDLDLYVSTYCLVNFETDKPCKHLEVYGYCSPESYVAADDFLYRNEGDGTFTDVSEASGIRKVSPKGRGLGVIATDLTGDGKIDIFVANDGTENFLFENKGDGTFEDIALVRGVAMDMNGDEQGCMGVDISDFNNDGRPDIVVTNYQKQSNALYTQDESGFFTDAATSSRLGTKSLPWVGWGTNFLDYDNDGKLDVFIANGHLEDNIKDYDQSSTYLQSNQLLRNTGSNNGKSGFGDVTDFSGPGLKIVLSTRGAAFGDIDNDGDIDIVLCNSRSKPNVLINDGGNQKHWIGFKLSAKQDPFALNASVTLHIDGKKHTREVRSGGSYASQNDLRLHFGLGTTTRIPRAEVRWPDGSVQVLGTLEVDQYHEVRQK
jgi:hypothetical protein